MSPSEAHIKSFQNTVLSYYQSHGRHGLPWRTSHRKPYHILVSEVMLQQTQVERVIPKFLAFIEKFPTIKDLTKAPQSEVIKMWSGLGYNRRARFLWLGAHYIVKHHQGVVPQDLVELHKVPGIGPYTASAILAFAYNRPVTVIETNIRTVFIHHFFTQSEVVKDAEIIPYITSTLKVDNPREWYAALMDYGTYLKSTVGNLTRKSQSYTKQSKFTGSAREIRGEILRVLQKHSMNQKDLLNHVRTKYPKNTQNLEGIVTNLIQEELITKRDLRLSLD